MTSRLDFVLAALLLVACGNGGNAPARSADGAVVEIQEVSPEQSQAQKSDEPLPGARPSLPAIASEPAPEEVDEDDTGLSAQPSPWGHGGGGPDCDQAADCCLKFVQKNGPDPSLLSMCDSLRRAPTSSCVHLLSSFRSMAPQVGVQCN